MVEVPIHEQIAAVARVTPDAIAIRSGPASLRYAELVGRADRIAAHLRRGGAKQGDVIGVCMDREAALIVAMLGVLRAGCCYLPLDLDYPAARLELMLADSGAVGVIAPSGLIANGPPRIDIHAATREPLPDGSELPSVSADDLAYIIYTSGSTGRPKGVAVTHGNVARLFGVVRERIPFDAGDIWSWFHSPAFDFSVWEIWGALTSGGSVVVVGLADARDPAALAGLLRDTKTTLLSQTPSAFGRLLPLLLRDGPSWPLRTVILGGEPVSVTALEQILGGPADGWPRVFNLYGITEATVHATVKELTRHDLATGVRSPIGTPLRDLHLAVLDQDRRPVRAGEPGELWIGGAGVARGYVGQPELTAERFVTGLLPQHGDVRWYRTGDLVRALGSGEFESIGRIDRQVKLRGFRIELGEIEAALAGHPDVSGATVELREASAHGEPQLAAYVVLAGEAAPAESELRDWLARRLPVHMIPSAFAAVDAFPLTMNGKVDRNALVRMTGRPLPRNRGQAPVTPAEAALVKIWADVFGLPDVGTDDSFFAVGGDSMLALTLAAACKAEGIAITVKDVFQHPTLSDLAAVTGLRTNGPAATPAEPTATNPARPEGIEAIVPASQMQCGVLFEAELDLRMRTYHVVSGSAISGLGEVTRELVAVALADLAARSPALRTGFDLSKYDQPMQVVRQYVRPRLSYVDLTSMPPTAQQATIAELFDAEQRGSFHHSDFPLWRLSCAKTAPGEIYAMLTHHHAVLDGWSVALFFDQFSAALAGRTYRTAPVSVQESASRFEATALRSADDERYWRAVAQTWSPLPGVHQPTAEAGAPLVLQASIDPAFRAMVAKTAAEWRCSPKHLHLAAHLRSLERFAGWSDYAATGLVVNARPEEPEARDALGMFLNVVPFVVDGLGRQWRELAERVRVQEAHLMRHRWFPLATMVRRFSMPALNVWLNYTDFSGTAMRRYLASVTEVSPTGMPLTVSIVDDGVIVQASPRIFSAERASELLESHMSSLRAEVNECS